MPKLVVSKGKLLPNATGVISPMFVDPRAIAGLQIQPFGGILTLNDQDFSYE